MNYEVNYYNLDGDSELQNAYNDVTESPWFIQNNNTNSAGQFFKKGGQYNNDERRYNTVRISAHIRIGLGKC